MATFSYTFIFSLLLASMRTEAHPSLNCIWTKNCNACILLTDPYGYSCPPFPKETDILMTAKPKDVLHYLQIHCIRVNNDRNELPAELLKRQHLGDFMIHSCPVPSTFKEILEKFAVNKTVSLRYELGNLSNVKLSKKHFAELGTLQRLHMENDKIENLEEDVLEEMPNLVEISLKSNNLRQLPENIFSFVPELVHLNLEFNELDNLPLRIFKNLTKLETLTLQHNNLTTFKAGIFKDLIELAFLDLSNNYLSSLPRDIFHNLKNLKDLNLDSNNLQQLPENLLMLNQNLQHFRLSYNQNLTLPNGLLANLRHLSKIALTHNNLKAFPEHTFFNSTNVQEIRLPQNELKELPVKLFDGLEKLHFLDLSYNQLHTAEKYFAPLHNLEKLYLDNNLITEISEAFKNLYNLKNLDLSSNRIQNISDSAFRNNNFIIEINLAHNKLRKVESNDGSIFYRCTEIEQLNLSHNFITSINSDLKTGLTKLHKLDLSYNRITSVEYEALLMMTGHKVELNLSNNNISQVDLSIIELFEMGLEDPSELFSRASVSLVNLSNNPIDCDCNAFFLIKYFNDMTNPRYKTMVRILPDGLKCASPPELRNDAVEKLHPNQLSCQLEQLVEDYTDCPSGCSCQFRKWDQSVVISCKKSNLTTVPQILLPMSSAINYYQTEVHLEENLLTAGPSSEDIGYENVTRLFLSNNRIKQIDWIPPKTEVLHLHQNNIERLNDPVLDVLNTSGLVNITLHDNPWKCDCFATNLTNFLRSHLKKVDPRQIKCSVEKTKLIDLTEKDLCYIYTFLMLLLSLCSAILFFVIAVGVALFYRYQQEIKVWLFAHNMLLWWVRKVDKNKQYDAFICFSHKDEEFVLQQLVSVLEKDPHPYKLCIHYRDWIPGEFISSQIAKSVQNSCRTIIVLSRNFLESVWGIVEFRTAHAQSMAEGRARVIVVIYGDVDLNADLDDELKAYIRTNTYVKWGDPYFWNKVRYALPHSKFRKMAKSGLKDV